MSTNRVKYWGTFLFLVFYVCLFIGLAAFSHPSSDDYGGAITMRDGGFWKPQLDMWQNWMGRFTAMFIGQTIYLFDVLNNYGWHVLICVTLSFSSLFFLVSSAFNELKLRDRLFISVMLQALWLGAGVGLEENLYWFNGTFYYYTVIFLAFELAMIINIYKDVYAKRYFYSAAVLIFLNSGVVELSAAYQLPMLLAAVIICMISGAGKKQALKYIFILLCVAALGFIVQLLNPGNNARASVVIGEGARNISAFIKSTFFFGPLNALRFFLNPLIYVVLPFYPAIVNNVKQPGFIRELPFKFRIWHIFGSSCNCVHVLPDLIQAMFLIFVSCNA